MLSGPLVSEPGQVRVLVSVPCADCRSTVLLVPTEKSGGGKLMPLDAVPSDDGLCFLVDNPRGDGWWVRVVGHRQPVPGELEAAPRYTAHWGTCPRGQDRWVRPRRRVRYR